MTSITFVRHGNTDWNNERRAQGHSHNPLSEIGRAQALAVADRLAEESWDVLISSDLLRAKATAAAVSARIGLPVSHFDQRLREIGRGQIEGTTEEERVRKWGLYWHELDLGQESLEALRARGLDFALDAVRRYPGKRVLAVSHGLIIGQTLKGMMADETTGNDLKNTSVTTVIYEEGGWRYGLYNCVRHLAP